FGFEESCGYLSGTHVRDKDGVMACMLVCEMAQSCKTMGSSVWEALQELYRHYGYLGTRLMNFDIAGALPMQQMNATMARLRRQPIRELAGHAVTEVRDYLTGLDGLPASNVLAFVAGPVKAIVRPSGTEPKVKIYLSAQADDSAGAEALLTALEADIHAALHA
ncbi:MAG: phospho-sugar mutase, partial [Candidatus Limiplasma sp.]|nr:phospho-sugar mutase [Candidatus Limiplasma sp.]